MLKLPSVQYQALHELFDLNANLTGLFLPLPSRKELGQGHKAKEGKQILTHLSRCDFLPYPANELKDVASGFKGVIANQEGTFYKSWRSKNEVSRWEGHVP